MRISWPIWAWLLQLAMLLAMHVTIVTLTSDCSVDYPFKEKPRLPYVDALLKESNAKCFLLLIMF